jgi:hypothetical protein
MRERPELGERDGKRLRVRTYRNCRWRVLRQEFRCLLRYLMGVLGTLTEYTFEEQA